MHQLIPIHKHFGELLILLPLVVIAVALFKGKTVLPRITAVLIDIQFVLGLATLVLVTKTVCVLHIVCMFLAMGLAHAVAKKENQVAVASGFAGVLALIVLGYLFQKGVLPNGDLRITLG